MFYQFNNQKDLDNLLSRVNKSLVLEDKCMIWEGETSYDRPRYTVRNKHKKSKTYDLCRLFYQIHHPDAKEPKKTRCTILRTCDNKRCVNHEHLVLDEDLDWNPIEISQRLKDKSERQERRGDFEIGCLL